MVWFINDWGLKKLPQSRIQASDQNGYEWIFLNLIYWSCLDTALPRGGAWGPVLPLEFSKNRIHILRLDIKLINTSCRYALHRETDTNSQTFWTQTHRHIHLVTSNISPAIQLQLSRWIDYFTFGEFSCIVSCTIYSTIGVGKQPNTLRDIGIAYACRWMISLPTMWTKNLHDRGSILSSLADDVDSWCA